MSDDQNNNNNNNNVKEIIKKQPVVDKNILNLLSSMNVDKNAAHAFWDTQPVPKIDAQVEKSGPIEVKTLDDVRKEPLTLPALFEWVVLDVNDQVQLNDVYTLLNENYVEDDDNMFRFDYSIPFLKWALQPPHYLKDWHIGVRVKESKKLVAFISAIPATINVDKTDSVKMVEINFLCVHKKLREKRLAPVLIKEITRRVNLQNIWQAAYTAGIVLPKPVASCRYYHRSLNPKKLVECKFSSLPPRVSMSLLIKLNRVEENTKCPGIRPLTKADVPSATRLLAKYLSQYSLAPSMSEEEVWHWLAPQKNVMDCYVVVDPKTGEVTDMCSFYTLPSSVIGNPKHKTLKAAFSFYNIATSVPLVDLMADALHLAKKGDFDVFNCLDIFENSKFIKEHKFQPGDGNLQYYLYNYATQTKDPSAMGLVLL
ncbi:glycylpeptide N-tetradecanoyltransferase [Heterostelium album PN500]|uniref:Glycylpeptide N-tetradecanoyltransferase n=1 Tax=Heterostelium pallidum (strain ATCC 26659 / Pp 5 / PN500) TaxID=670386 RepID=D3BQ08_HETP5|nr:glycylpeptide N-tetradecanoyltransferase [Heterostelium album PN500]EFA76559.1 glycylpeptide N-tetradecanoyltransferase [Heterostelium album PN500]|eukprot:XP_020428691.1 glycylpeptide N-tetradecanoyltransferase [Heterostelium album PN500]